jgi:preprotein translocase subunit SecD
MANETLRALLKEWRIRLLILCVLFLAILPLALNGLDFGTDFTGGTLIEIQLEKPVNDTGTMSTITTVLESRLNGYGLKDISVKPWGDRFVIVEVSSTNPEDVKDVEGILSKQGRFEAIIDGQLVLVSKDLIQIITNPQKNYGYSQATRRWNVPFVISAEGSQKFADIAKGRCDLETGECDKIYMFIDRPLDSAIVIPTDLNYTEYSMSVDQAEPDGEQRITMQEFSRNTKTPVIVTNSLGESLVNLLDSYGNITKVIIPENVTGYDTTLFESRGYTVIEKPKDEGDFYWLWSATNLRSILFLTPGVTTGEPIREAVITGGAADLDEATSEMTEMVVILRSGKLPVSLSIASSSTVSPTLGEDFLRDSLVIGISALFAVAAVIFVRYRHWKLMLAMMTCSFLEVLIILGVASIISWELDLAAIAGIIAAVGTGVDALIVISDEVLSKEAGEVNVSAVAKIKRAFTIVITAAATTIAALFPLMTVGLGVLKGFAITTIIGVLVGALITRPAFAKVVEKIV